MIHMLYCKINILDKQSVLKFTSETLQPSGGCHFVIEYLFRIMIIWLGELVLDSLRPRESFIPAHMCIVFGLALYQVSITYKETVCVALLLKGDKRALSSDLFCIKYCTSTCPLLFLRILILRYI